MITTTDEVARKQAEALGNIMAGDSRRIDALVGDVGSIKGEVSAVRSDVARVGAGVDELRGAMTIMSRHQVMMEGLAADNRGLSETVAKIDSRVDRIEVDMPGLRELRTWAVRGVLAVAGLVGLAVVGLVVVK